jgi:hypothetical protein
LDGPNLTSGTIFLFPVRVCKADKKAPSAPLALDGAKKSDFLPSGKVATNPATV